VGPVVFLLALPSPPSPPPRQALANARELRAISERFIQGRP
jgi:hypothetical protein